MGVGQRFKGKASTSYIQILNRAYTTPAIPMILPRVPLYLRKCGISGGPRTFRNAETASNSEQDVTPRPIMHNNKAGEGTRWSTTVNANMVNYR